MRPPSPSSVRSYSTTSSTSSSSPLSVQPLSVQCVVALLPSEQLREAILQLQRDLDALLRDRHADSVQWISAEALHLPLCSPLPALSPASLSHLSEHTLPAMRALLLLNDEADQTLLDLDETHSSSSSSSAASTVSSTVSSASTISAAATVSVPDSIPINLLSAYPSWSKPRSIWVGPETKSEMRPVLRVMRAVESVLNRSLEKELLSDGYRRSESPRARRAPMVLPRITIGRLNTLYVPDLRAVIPRGQPFFEDMAVNRIVLLQAEYSSDGAERYTELDAIDLV